VQHLASKEEEQALFALGRARLASVTAAVTILVATFVAIALAVALIRGIVRPLAGLNLAAARIGQGDFDAVAPPTGADEFEELRGGLERMAAGLREREARLLKAERLAGLGALAAGVAHELNNPLGVILGYVKTLRRAEVSEEVSADLRIVEEEAHQCRRIVEDLVAFAREPRLERRPTDVGALASEVVTRLGRSGELRQGQVVLDDVGGAEADVDPARLAQVLRNLLLNASAASPEGERIDVAITKTADLVVVRVADHGTGIAPDDVPRLFEPFFSRRRDGTGLGLAVTHGIVMAHGGQINVESQQGRGTVVSVTLPVTRREQA
jgi:two-component system NtrC family sensor kinase